MTPPVGLLYMAASALAFSLMSLLVKLVGEALPVFELVAVRSLFMLAFSFVHLRAIGESPWGNRRRLLLLRGGLGFCAVCCFYYGVTHLPLADATVIQYMNPVFTAILAAAILGESVRALEGLGIGASLAGVVLIQQPAMLFGGSARLPLFDVLVALGGALFAAGAYVTVRHLRDTEHPIVIIFFFSLVAFPASVAFAAPNAVLPAGYQWAALVGIGLTTYAGQVCLTRGLHLEKAGRATAITYLQIVFAFGWDLLVFDAYPTPLSLAGATLIVGSALAISLYRAGRDDPTKE